MNVALMLQERAQEIPAAPALIDARHGESRVMTFAELEQAVAQAASLLWDAGLRSGDAVLILQPMSIELYVALLAVLRNAMAAMFVDPGCGREHVERCCLRYPPRGLIATPRAHWLRLISPAVARIPVKFSVGRAVPGAADFTRYREVAPRRGLVTCDASTPALVTFTSGSGGMPKAALRTHGFLVTQHGALERCLAPAAGDVQLTTLPIFGLSHLALGGTTVIPDADLRQPGRIDPTPVMRQIACHGVSRIVASPAFLERIVGDCEKRVAVLNQINSVFTGGAPVFPGLMRRMRWAMPRASIVAVYGSTEAEPIAHIAWDDVSADDEALMRAGKGLLAGCPVSDIDLRIVLAGVAIPASGYNPAQFDAIARGAGEAGEIVVSGAHVLGGYLNGIGDRETKFSAAGKIWHRTGDLGYRAADGRLWLLGRCGAEVRDGRGVLYPFAVECAAQQHPAVRRAALAAIGNQRLLLVEPARTVDQGVIDELTRGLAWASIDAIAVVAGLPTDYRHNSKIDYPRLQRWLRRGPLWPRFGMRLMTARAS
jgi:acyl-CoA synthetase (AMP-forming)/AMP-acid ligase II